MSIFPPEKRIWWKEPIERSEILWIMIALVWSLIMFFMMPYWHIAGEQNLSNEAYRINPDVFAERTEVMADKYTVREEGDTGMPVVHPPAGSDIYMLARLWEWWPVLELEKTKRTDCIYLPWIINMVFRCCPKTSTFKSIRITRWSLPSNQTVQGNTPSFAMNFAASDIIPWLVKFMS